MLSGEAVLAANLFLGSLTLYKSYISLHALHLVLNRVWRDCQLRIYGNMEAHVIESFQYAVLGTPGDVIVKSHTLYSLSQFC